MGGGNHIEALRFKHKTTTITATDKAAWGALIPVDETLLAQEQIDKWLLLTDKGYFCKAPKAGYYHFCSEYMQRNDTNSGNMFVEIRHYLASDGSYLNSGYTHLAGSPSTLPIISMTEWMNAEDTLRYNFYADSATTAKNVYSSKRYAVFMYLGNDAGDY